MRGLMTSGPCTAAKDRLVYRLCEVVPSDLEPSVGVGDAKFPAFVAARTGQPGLPTWVPPDATRFLSAHSIDLLPISAEIKTSLHLLGLHRMGEVFPTPQGAFGGSVRLRRSTSVVAVQRHRQTGH